MWGHQPSPLTLLHCARQQAQVVPWLQKRSSWRHRFSLCFDSGTPQSKVAGYRQDRPPTPPCLWRSVSCSYLDFLRGWDFSFFWRISPNVVSLTGCPHCWWLPGVQAGLSQSSLQRELDRWYALPIGPQLSSPEKRLQNALEAFCVPQATTPEPGGPPWN